MERDDACSVTPDRWRRDASGPCAGPWRSSPCRPAMSRGPAGDRTGPGPAGRPGFALARYVPKQDKFLLPRIRRARRPPGRLEGLGGVQAAERHQARCASRRPRRPGHRPGPIGAAPDRRIKPAELIGLFKLAAKQGFAAGFWGENPG